MTSSPQLSLPLGLPDQFGALPTSPQDRGDDTQDRFRYQWAIGVVLLAEGIVSPNPAVAVWCEHHDDFLVELSSGKFRAVQVKTDSSENSKWLVTAENLTKSLGRFCALEKNYGAQIEQYEFCSNAPVYVPSVAAKPGKKMSSSPMRVREVCRAVAHESAIASPYSEMFQQLVNMLAVPASILLSVFRKLEFRQGPPLRGYLEVLAASVIPSLPQCVSMPSARLKHVRDELMRLVETASGIPTEGIDGALSYIATNGKPEVTIRGKCITIDAAKTSVDQASQSNFRYVSIGERLKLGDVIGQKNTLHKKLRNAYLESQFEPMWLRMVSAERRLMEKAIANPELFDNFALQLEGAVLTECKDAEAFAALEPDERKRGLTIYRDVLQKLSHLAEYESIKVENEPKDTLLGIAGMLSGSCRFAWGVPLEEDESGA